MTGISGRKADHISITVNGDAAYRKTAGFERYDFVHEALPEINFDQISLETPLLNRLFGAPLMISSMTGGYEKGAWINEVFARTAEAFNLPMGLGSMRAMIEHPELAKTFSVARKVAPNAFLCANIGAVQLRDPAWIEKTLAAMDLVKADALIVHLNSLQELMQPEGDRHFSGILEGINAICNASERPVIAKETGAGFSRNTAGRLLAAGVAAIDVAGAGGTSWSAVELARRPKHNGPDDTFLREWGIPTVRCLEEIAPLKGPYTFDLIASGGVYGASEILKAMALGANFTAMARPLIQVLMQEGEDALHQWMETLHHQLRTGMLLLGVEKTSQLSSKHLYKVL